MKCRFNKKYFIENVPKLRAFILRNFFILIMFFISLIYFLIQHYFNLTWDFKVYVMNARYLFLNGGYFEVYRAPLASLFLGLFIWIGKLGEYFYIILVSLLFFYSSIKLSDALYEKYFFKFKINKNFSRIVFYGLSLNFFTLHYGVLVGTELLGLALFELFLAFFILNKKSGHLLGLACLTRYNFFIFSFLLLINKDYKKILKNLALFLLILIPWYVFNLIKWGNGFTSIISSYSLNILSRLDKIQSFDFSFILIVINWLIPLFLLGLIIAFYYHKKYSLKYPFLFSLIFILIIFDFYNTPFKIVRYLFNLILPVTFFSSITIFYFYRKIKIPKEKISKIISVLLIGILFISSINLLFNPFSPSLLDLHKSEKIYQNIAIDISQSKLSNCHFLSSHWVLINYYYPCSTFMNWNINKSLSEGYPIILFYKISTIDDKYNKSEINNYNFVSKTSDYAILAPKNMTNLTCVKWQKYDIPYVKEPCKIISNRFEKLKLESFIFKLCNFINFN